MMYRFEICNHPAADLRTNWDDAAQDAVSLGYGTWVDGGVRLINRKCDIATYNSVTDGLANIGRLATHGAFGFYQTRKKPPFRFCRWLGTALLFAFALIGLCAMIFVLWAQFKS